MNQSRPKQIRYGWPQSLTQIWRMMKLATLFLFLGCLQVSATAYSQKTSITLSLKDVSLEQALHTITQESGYLFLYSNEKLAHAAGEVTFKVQDATIGEVMNACLQGFPLSYVVMDKTVILMPKPQKDVLQNAPDKEISGVVKDSVTGNPIVGATVKVKGKNKGTVTDEEGKFSLDVEDDALLEVSYLGYGTRLIPVSGKESLTISLLEAATGLNQLVVVGYTKQTKEKVTSSVSSLDMSAMEHNNSVYPVRGMQGKMAGVIVPISSGMPGASPGIRIRGGTSLDGTGDPLVIVDGVYGHADGIMRDLNSDDIESIQVLKDASATAAYGARGANGVIIVTTKDGAFNQKPVVTFKVREQLETQARKYNYLNAHDYLILGRKTWATGTDIYDPYTKLYIAGNSVTVPTYTKPGQWGKATFLPAYYDNLVHVEGQGFVDNLMHNEGYDTLMDPVNYGQEIIYKDNNFQNLVWNTGLTQDYNLSIKGGGKRTKYFFSAGYFGQNGVFIGTHFNRFSARSNVTFKVSDRVKIKTNISYGVDRRRGPHSLTNTMRRGTRITPLNRIYYEDGTPVPGEYLSVRYATQEVEDQINKTQSEKVTMRAEGDVKLMKGLLWKPSVSLYMENYDRTYFEKFFQIQARPRDKSLTRNTIRQLMIDQILQYKKDFSGGHHLTALLGFNFTRFNRYNSEDRGERSATDYIYTFSGDPATSNIDGNIVSNFGISSRWEQNKTISGFAQLNYDYKAKYLFSASLRRDGFSEFAPNHKYAMFPSVSAGWNISKEPFWQLNFIDELKLRGSYGETGLSNLVSTDTYGRYAGGYLYNSTGGILRTSLANPNLVWETTSILDGGIDLDFLQNRIGLSLDYYNKITRNRLATLPLPRISGFSGIKYNVGQMQNQGIEVAVHATVLKFGDFSWNTHLTFAYNRPKVLKLPPNGRPKNRIGGGTIHTKNGGDIEVGGYAEGERPGAMYGWQMVKIFATDAEAAAAKVVDQKVSSSALGKPKHAGDAKWLDVNGDGIIDDKDVVFFGYKMPDKIGGMQNTFNYKNFSLRFNVDYALGNTVANGALARSMGSVRAGNEGATAFAKNPEVWHHPGQKNAKYPRFLFNDTDFGYKNHKKRLPNDMGSGATESSDASMYIRNDNWLAFRELSISYRLPDNITKKIHSSEASVNLAVYNLGYLTSYDGLNPEIYNGHDSGDYPRPREFSLTLKVSF